MIELNKMLYGVVEDIHDPLHIGRVRVRWASIHTDNKTRLPTKLLPWSNVMGSINSAGISGKGMAPVGMVQGTMVVGVPMDDGYQSFLIMGTIAGNRSVHINSSYGFNDPNGEYPIAGVNGDINSRAGGNANTGSSFNADADTIESEIPGSKDPTIPEKVYDPEAYKDTPWMPIAQGELGVNEADNPNRVKEYHKVGGGLMAGPTTAWCASFIGWTLDKAGIKHTRSASSRSYLKYGESVGKNNVPFGAIAVFGTPGGWTGHVAFVLEDQRTHILCLGGNQSAKDHRNGGEVTKTRIPKNGGRLVLLDCVMPTNLQGK